MCKALDDLYQDGVAEGEAKVVAMIRKKLNKGLENARIADVLELESFYVDKVVDLIEEDIERTDLQVAEIMIRNS